MKTIAAVAILALGGCRCADVAGPVRTMRASSQVEYEEAVVGDPITPEHKEWLGLNAEAWREMLRLTEGGDR